METVQNLTHPKTELDITQKDVNLREIQQDDYIAFVALGGLVPDPSGEKVAIKLSYDQYASRIGVVRQTLYDWRKSIPDFWEKVAVKRIELGGKDRLANVWNGLYLKAAAGNTEAAKLYLANFDKNFKMPTEKREVELGDGFAELIAAKRAQQAREAKVIDVTPED